MRRRQFIAGLGSTAAWSLEVRAQAQQANVPVIGYLNQQWPPPDSSFGFLNAFHAGLADGGFIEGRNLSIEYRWAKNNFGLLPSLAADLASRQVAVIVVSGAAIPIHAAIRATSTIPIVFVYGGDPVKDGFVASLNRPGGNITGMTTISAELAGKRLDLLLKVVPQARKIGFLSGDKSFPTYEQQTTAILAAGRAVGVEIMIVECHDDRDFESAVTKMVEGGAGAMIVANFALPNRYKLVRLAALHKLTAIYPFSVFARAGGLMSYDTDTLAMHRRLGSAYVARILKGMRPGDLPVEQPTKFEFVINLKTAKALGLTIPETLLATADEVIE
jgi:putative ABC transport system substrate-binding protein